MVYTREKLGDNRCGKELGFEISPSKLISALVFGMLVAFLRHFKKTFKENFRPSVEYSMALKPLSCD